MGFEDFNGIGNPGWILDFPSELGLSTDTNEVTVDIKRAARDFRIGKRWRSQADKGKNSGDQASATGGVGMFHLFGG